MTAISLIPGDPFKVPVSYSLKGPNLHSFTNLVTQDIIQFTVYGSRLKAMKEGLYSLDKYPVHPLF
jgi:hypothetical protein